MSWVDFMMQLLGGGDTSSPTSSQTATPRSAPTPTRSILAPQQTASTPALTPQQQDPLFWGQRSEVSKKIIREQVYSVADNIFKDGVKFDEADAHWVVVPNYKLPPAWRDIARSTSMMIVFPTLYPEIPPIGFYLKSDLPNAPGGHFYASAYHDAAKAPLEQGWKWYCVYVNPGSWQPSAYRGPGSWQRGDNLYSYLTLIKEALSSSDG